MATNKPRARINSNLSINKAIQNCKAYTNAHTNDNLKIHISGGNSKLGSIMNISLPPVATCHNCSSCSKYCYAIRTYNRFTDTAAGWNENYLLFDIDPGKYFYEISKAVKTQRFFRWHVSGDIVNSRYLSGMIETAFNNPKVEFLAFTKAYHIVNEWIRTESDIPNNLHIVFSASPGVTMNNPYRLPECHINFQDSELNTYTGGAEYIHYCGGNCTECAVNGCGCFFLKNGDVTIINQH
jgi:hypothetical protein